MLGTMNVRRERQAQQIEKQERRCKPERQAKHVATVAPKAKTKVKAKRGGR